MTATKKYKVVRGINWKPTPKAAELRAEPGETLTAADLKGGNIKWFLEVGAIQVYTAPGGDA